MSDHLEQKPWPWREKSWMWIFGSDGFVIQLYESRAHSGGTIVKSNSNIKGQSWFAASQSSPHFALWGQLSKAWLNWSLTVWSLTGAEASPISVLAPVAWFWMNEDHPSPGKSLVGQSTLPKNCNIITKANLVFFKLQPSIEYSAGAVQWRHLKIDPRATLSPCRCTALHLCPSCTWLI